MEESKGRAGTEVLSPNDIEPNSSKNGADRARAKGPPEAAEEQGWIDFRDQCRRQMGRSLDQRIKYGFCRMYKPVLDDAPWRSFDTMAEYRAWCAEHLPDYLGFKPAKP